jgi:hypothetical protein
VIYRRMTPVLCLCHATVALVTHMRTRVSWGILSQPNRTMMLTLLTIYFSERVGEAEARPSESSVLERKRKESDSGREGCGVDKRDRQEREKGSLPPVIGRWAETCFPVGSQTTETELRELLKEAADSARDNFGPDEAIAWAEGYRFPPEFVRNDLRCLEEAQGDFVAMVRRRLTELEPGRMNSERISRQRPDNPELGLLNDFVTGMKVHLPEGFRLNGMMPRTDRRPIYETVATAVNKMLGAVVDQKLAYLLPLDVAQRHIPNLHLCKAHWTVKKGKPSGRPIGDLSNVDGTKINTDETAAAATAY